MNTSHTPSAWQLLVLSLPASSATPRMRIWRALKALGCGALRDGAYLLPRAAAAPFAALAEETIAEGGIAWLLDVQPQSSDEEALFRGLFGRNQDYAEFIGGLRETRKTLPALTQQEITRLLRKSGRDYDALRSIDYFPNETSLNAEVSWLDFRAFATQIMSPDEPHAATGAVQKRDLRAYQNKLWATRRHLWVDRVASAWLIQRFIDRQAHFLWLAQPADCPSDASGFDFDGAAFTHIGELVTFEVLLASFGLDKDPGLLRIATIVHALDLGGDPVPEAIGFEAIMTGMRQRFSKDDQLLAEMGSVLDALYAHFSEQHQKKNA
jgi:hypothetical protein